MFGWGRSSAEGLIAPHERSRGGVASEAVTGSRSVRIVVVGDSGVGKSSLVHVVCERSILRAPTWTVGCTLNAQLYRPRVRGVGEECFVEWVDVGGSSTYAAARSAFYEGAEIECRAAREWRAQWEVRDTCQRCVKCASTALLTVNVQSPSTDLCLCTT